jgi:hypothetical protein
MAVQETTTKTILPDWYTQYAQNVLGRAYQATGEPYQAYKAPRIAGFQPTQTEAFNMFRRNIGSYQPYISAAGSAVNEATGSFTDPGVAGRYMNPYIQNVISGIGSTAARNLSENILPQINRTFVGGGTFGGSRSAEFTNRAIRDTQETALSKQMQALSDAYSSGMGQYNTEAGRRLTAAGTLADLGSTLQEMQGKDYAGLADIGQQERDLAQKSAQLAYEDFVAQRDYPYQQVQRLANIGGQPSASGSGTKVQSEPGPSTTSQILGGLGTIASILGGAGVFKKGGEVEKPVKNGKRNLKHPMHGLGWLKDVK